MIETRSKNDCDSEHCYKISLFPQYRDEIQRRIYFLQFTNRKYQTSTVNYMDVEQCKKREVI